MFRVRRRLAVAMAVAGVGVLAVAGVAWAVVGAHPVPTYQTNGRVNEIVVSGSTVYIGGQFTSVRPAGDPAGTGEVPRNHAAAFNISTGALLPWDPNVTGSAVRAIEVNSGKVFLGGSFSKVGTTGEKNVAAVDPTTGAVISTWKATTNGQVNAMVLQAGTLYLGGNFTTVDSSARSYLAGVSATTSGTVTSWAPSADDDVKAMVVSPDGTRIVAGGLFTHINGSSQNHIAALDVNSGNPLTWHTHTAYSVIDLAVDAGGVYVAGAGGGGNFAAFNPSTGAQLWQGGTNGNVQAIGVVGGIVYLGGHFQTYCGPQQGMHTCANPLSQDKLLAVNEGTGALQTWAPGANSVLGVFALQGDSTTGALFSGGDFTSTGQRAQQGFAEFTP
jgi:PQQ-like domain